MWLDLSQKKYNTPNTHISILYEFAKTVFSNFFIFAFQIISYYLNAVELRSKKCVPKNYFLELSTFSHNFQMVHIREISVITADGSRNGINSVTSRSIFRFKTTSISYDSAKKFILRV